MSNQYLKPEHTERLRKAVRDLDGVLALARRMPDQVMANAIITKVNAHKNSLIAQYAEIQNEDGSVLAKHPSIGFITIEEALCDEPVRLFAARVKSLSTNRIKVYHADALIAPSGNVTYVNRTLLLDTEMSQMAFANLIANPGRGHYPATVREYRGVPVVYENDMSSIGAKKVFEAAIGVTEGLSQWVDEMLKPAMSAAQRGGVMSKKAKDEILDNASTMTSWAKNNPAYYAKLLGEFAANTTTDIKLEVMSASKLKENQ